MGAKAFSFTRRTKVFADGTGTEEQCVTSRRLTESPVGPGVNRPISESEVGE
jgi:hypothetical protein